MIDEGRPFHAAAHRDEITNDIEGASGETPSFHMVSSDGSQECRRSAPYRPVPRGPPRVR
jgi:hypothetical protein